MNMKKVVIFTFLFLFSVLLYSQSQNGYWLTNKGTLGALLVFAEAVDDPIDTWADQPNWPRGQMPLNPDAYFDHSFTNGQSINLNLNLNLNLYLNLNLNLYLNLNLNLNLNPNLNLNTTP